MAADLAGADDDDVLLPFQAAGDVREESTQVLGAMRLAGVLVRAAATMAERRVVAHVARRSVMAGNLGGDVFDRVPAIPVADDGRVTRIDPDER